MTFHGIWKTPLQTSPLQGYRVHTSLKIPVTTRFIALKCHSEWSGAEGRISDLHRSL